MELIYWEILCSTRIFTVKKCILKSSKVIVLLKTDFLPVICIGNFECSPTPPKNYTKVPVFQGVCFSLYIASF